MSNTVIAYTDGACSGNPGTGAWAYRVEWPGGDVAEDAGAEDHTTNNREELKAIREALRAIRARIGDDADWRIVIRTDSKGAINWLQRTWKRNANLDLFPTIDPLVDRRVIFEYVRGHSGDPGNERVDALAVAAVRERMGQRAADATSSPGARDPGMAVYAVLRFEGGDDGPLSVHEVLPTFEDAEREVARLRRNTRSGSAYRHVLTRYYPAGR